MDLQLLVLFIVLNALNVVIQTIKSLCTIKSTKMVAAIANAVAFGFYTVVIVYMVCELPLLWKVIIVATCNFIGVYGVKWFEEKLRKDKLWKVEVTIDKEENWKDLVSTLKNKEIPCNYVDINKYILLNCYCATQKESATVKSLLEMYNAKYFVEESKEL